MSPAEGGKVRKFLNAGFTASFMPSTNNRRLVPTSSSEVDSRSIQPAKAAIISTAIIDHSFDIVPTGPPSLNFENSSTQEGIDIPSSGTNIALTEPHAPPKDALPGKNSQAPSCYWYDDSALAEAIDTGQMETGHTVIFDAMAHFSFQDAEGKWQPYYGHDRMNNYRVTNVPLAESGQLPRPMSTSPNADLKGKKPVYDAFIGNSDCVASIEESGTESASYSNPETSLRASECTCIPADVELALELYLPSTKKQHEQFRHSLRRVSGLTYLLDASQRSRDLVHRLTELRKKVKELAELVTAEHIVSSVTLTEIHRLIDKALTPISEQVSALNGKFRVWSAADGRGHWRARRTRATKQKLKEDWEPRMKALSTRVDQATAWAQLVVIRITRSRWDW